MSPEFRNVVAGFELFNNAKRLAKGEFDTYPRNPLCLFCL
jgi:hypothetical protein